MAIIVEDYKTRADGVKLIRTYSTEGFKIRKLEKDWMGNFVETDEIYDEAIDIEGALFTYVETDCKIESPDMG